MSATGIPEFATRGASQLRGPTLRSEARILILQIWGCLAANAPGAVLANVASSGSEKQQIVQVALETFTREKKNGRWCATGTLDRQSQQTLDVGGCTGRPRATQSVRVASELARLRVDTGSARSWRAFPDWAWPGQALLVVLIGPSSADGTSH